jgi:hypothetical protein
MPVSFRGALVFEDLVIPTDFSTVTDEQLNALDTTARTAAAPLVTRANGEGDPLNAEEQAGLQRLAGVVSGVRQERESRIGKAAADRQSAKGVQDALAVFATEPATMPVTPEIPAVVPAVPADRPNVRVADVTMDSPPVTLKDPVVAADVQRFSRMVAAPNLATTNSGAEYANLDEVARAAEAQFASYPAGRGVGGQFLRNPVMYLQRDYPPELRIGEQAQTDGIKRVLDHAADQGRLPEGGLVAAAGWCAPSQIDYGLFELEGRAGMLDIPEVQISRGGVQFTTGPDFSAIFGGAGYFHQTEAQVIAATTKPCMVIPCPSFTEKRLEVEGVCITGAFLQDRGYPEMVSRFVRGALTAHMRKLNIFKINQLVAGSTLFDYTNVANLPVTTSEYKDLSTANRLLSLLGIQAVDYRAKYRMDPDATLEVVLPVWVLQSIRDDVRRRSGLDLDDAMVVTSAQVNQWMTAQGLRVQWVYDWLDAYNTTNTSTVGQTAGVYTLPTAVEALMYAPGTWVAGVADVVRLDTVYDAANLALNQYNALFSEEGIMVMKRGFESRRIKTTISPSGVLSATADMRTG